MSCAGNEGGRSAAMFFENGFHCAEAVVAAALQALQKDGREAVACASGFGAGLGRTCSEMCGALAGAVIAIGCFYGRSSPEESWEDAASMSVDLRQRFMQRHGATGCAELRQRFGEKEQMRECRRIVDETAEDLLVIIERHNQKRRSSAEGYVEETGAD